MSICLPRYYSNMSLNRFDESGSLLIQNSQRPEYKKLCTIVALLPHQLGARKMVPNLNLTEHLASLVQGSPIRIRNVELRTRPTSRSCPCPVGPGTRGLLHTWIHYRRRWCTVVMSLQLVARDSSFVFACAPITLFRSSRLPNSVNWGDPRSVSSQPHLL